MRETNPLPAPPPGKTGWPWIRGSGVLPETGGDLRVTIVTPSFNQVDYLEETIRSVLLQGYQDLDYIVVDGGSTDGSVDLIRRYEPWITWWVSEPDGGQADAINKGFSEATGSILGWLNSDDIFYPDFIARRVAEFVAAPEVDLFYGDVEVGSSSGGPEVIIRGSATDFETMVRTLDVPIPQQSTLWRAEVLEKVGDLDARWQVVLDREFFTRVARHCRLEYRPWVTGLFRTQPDSKSVVQQLKWVEELPEMYSEFFSDPSLPAEIKILERESLVAMEHMCAQLLWRNDRRRQWVGCVGRAVMRSPRQFARQFIVGGARSKVRGALRRLGNIVERPTTS